MKLRFKKLKKEAVIPSYAYADDAAFDLFSIEGKTLEPGERYVFKIGLASEIPSGYFVIFKPKSGLAVKAGIDVLAGLIDSGYRGEWGVVLINLGSESYRFEAGDKLAQGILLPVCQAEMIEVGDLDQTQRGKSGFGSSGK